MLSVKPVLDQVTLNVELIKHPISVFLHARSEDHNFVVLTQLIQELHAVRPDSEEALLALLLEVHEMYQGFVQIQHKAITVCRLRGQERWRHFGKSA